MARQVILVSAFDHEAAANFQAALEAARAGDPRLAGNFLMLAVDAGRPKGSGIKTHYETEIR